MLPDEVVGRFERVENIEEKCEAEGVLGVVGTGRLDGPNWDADFCMMTCAASGRAPWIGIGDWMGGPIFGPHTPVAH